MDLLAHPTVTDDAAVPRQDQTKAIPGDPSFVCANEGTDADNRANHNQSTNPPVAGDDVVHLEQDFCRQGKLSSVCLEETSQLGHHERDKNRDQAGARDGEEGGINQRLLDAVAQILRLHQVFDEAG